MTQTLQEILAKNNVTTNVSTNTATVQQNLAEQATTSSNMSNVSETQQEKESIVKKVLMSSDDLDTLDKKKFEGAVGSSNFRLEEDIYEAQCIKIELVDSQDYEGRPEEKFLWHFKVLRNSVGEEVSSPLILKHFTRLAFGEQSNNYKLYSIFFGSTPQTYNVLDCIGQECRLNVVDKKSAKGNVYSKIKDILKAKKK